MPDKSEDSKSDQKLDLIRAESQSLLEEIKKFRDQAEDQLKTAETARKRAEDQESQISQAKVKIEEHLKTAESSRKAADENAAQISQSKAKIEEQLKTVEATRKKADEDTSEYANQVRLKIEENLKTTDAIRKKADEDAQLFAQARPKFEEKIKEADDLRKKADESASYAFQAKVNAEDHAKTTAGYKGTAEADLSSIATNKKTFDALVAAVTIGKAAIEADIKTITDSRKAVEASSTTIVEAAEKGLAQIQKIEESKKTTDTLLKETEQMRDAAIQARNKTDNAQTQVEQFSKHAAELLSGITAANETSTTLSAEIKAMLTEAKTNEENLRQITEKLTKSFEISSNFEKDITKSSDELQKLIQKADGLLPGFTSVSLASAFGTHKKRFTIPKVAWIVAFVSCIVGLIYVAYPNFHAAVEAANNPSLQVKTWDEIWRGFAMRLPIVIPLVWLAIYAGRNYMLSIRLEEDYAYKEAVSIAFEGYKREMANIPSGDAANPAPLATWCSNVLKAIAERPGRIYEGKPQDITMMTEARNAAQIITEISKKQIAAK